MMNNINIPKGGRREKFFECIAIAGLSSKLHNFLNSLAPAQDVLLHSFSHSRETPASNPIAKTNHSVAGLTEANRQLEERIKTQTGVESELRRKNTELCQELEKERKLNDLKTKLLSMASHEFRTPLTTVMMAADMLENFGNSLTTNQRDNFLSRIKISTELMTELMNEILQYNRVDAGLETLASKEIDLTRFCSELVDEIRLISDHEHNIIFLVQQDTPEKVFNADPFVLRQILNNLLSNAVKYSPNGGTVKLLLKLSDSGVSFQVSDQGMGIPEDELTGLFDAFKRGSNVRNIQGTGLGLAIVKKYIELYKGEIRVESQVNRGTTFTVTLPMAQCPRRRSVLSNSRK